MKDYKLLILLTIFVVIKINCFAQLKSGQMIDKRDNQEYKWVNVNNRIWLAQNIDLYTKAGSWYFNNDSINNKKYGRLYTYEVAKQVCPDGWHLPSKFEFEELIMFYGSEENAARAITNLDSLGLNIPLAGWRSYTGGFANYDDTGLWTSTENEKDKELAYGLTIYGNQLFVANDIGKICGYYVRCIKNE